MSISLSKNITVRAGGRSLNALRPLKITPNFSDFIEGSCLIEFGQTQVLCTASFEPQAPKWLQGSNQGWVTAEYGMLPRATLDRTRRDKVLTAGRTLEISRLISRSLRASLDLKKMGEKQIIVDCDVLRADGGTRTASVTGGFVALALALKKLNQLGEIKEMPLLHYVSAVSVGLKGGEIFLDLDYLEDASMDVDMNFVMTEDLKMIEVQGTAEKSRFNKDQLFAMHTIAEQGCKELFIKQQEVLGDFFKIPKMPDVGS
jgi:ribonuclease PH